MTAQSIYKSPREINSFLAQIHSKVQRNQFTLYTSRQIASHLLEDITEEMLAAEVRYMLDHSGLHGYNAVVKYVDLKEGTAGQISLNNSTEKTVNINVSNQYRSNGHVLLAILAHEVCHKVLFVNGLYVMDESLNETFVDLATIYMGFGELILKGYRSRSGGVENILGYLMFDVYKVTHHLMCVLFDNKKVDDTDLEDIDIMAYDALKLWESKENKSQLLNNILFESEKPVAKTQKYIACLETVLEACRKDLKEFHDLQNRAAFGSSESTDRLKRDLDMYSCIYEYTLRAGDQPQAYSTYADKIDDILEETLFNLQANGIPGFDNLGKRIPVCPCCGERITGVKAEDEDVLVRCPSCRARFRYNGSVWTPTASQRKLVLKRKQEQEYIDAQIRSEIDRILEEERQRTIQETKQKIFKSMPGWLRWLAEDYFE